MEAIKDQGEKQIDIIEKQKENKLKTIEKDKIVYLEDKIDELFKMYSKSFDSQSKSSLKIFAKNENKISYKNLSYKILFPDSKFHIINFLKKYGTLFSLLEGLVTRKMTVIINYLINYLS